MSRFFLFKIANKTENKHIVTTEDTEISLSIWESLPSNWFALSQLGKHSSQKVLHYPNLGKSPRKQVCLVPTWETLPLKWFAKIADQKHRNSALNLEDLIK
ncbi:MULTISPECIES: hypothetical protein [unclassified Chryseobacterium]|jgi:hypothetical protein|uniref:hypothetical protein n=1 Tax=unclassified Chryseobacterium TaxID=2593645 RepID=UPI001C5A9AA5|nr:MULTISPECIES: hypothetical protein [unclassified Chryseobacterium]MBW3521988.1 hypothetical protein [Chryseobacterium sp. NKUCC03_KSP]MCD0456598.1 hypothetical protein [Chryseobacterium sp. LC2016-27]